MQNKLLYLFEEDYISKAVYNDKEESIYSIKNEINNLAKKHFVSIREYNKLVRKQLCLKNKIPLLLSKSLLLFIINSKKTKYVINYYNILKICFNGGIVFIFKDSSILKIDVSKALINKEIAKIKQIINYVNDLDL